MKNEVKIILYFGLSLTSIAALLLSLQGSAHATPGYWCVSTSDCDPFNHEICVKTDPLETHGVCIKVER